MFTRNRVRGNGREGILFRNESEPMSGHRNRFVDNEILDNGSAEEGYGVRVLGHTHDLTFERNRISDTGSGLQATAIFVGKNSTSPRLDDNELTGPVVRESENVPA